MPAFTHPVSFRVGPDLLLRIDEARGSLSRNAWLVLAVEAALDGFVLDGVSVGAAGRALGDESSSGSSPRPAPAEQPEVDPGLAVEVLRQAERDFPAREFRPCPKGGKR